MYWRETRGQQVRGSLVGNITRHGYRAVFIEGHAYFVHRLIWLAVHGSWPTGGVDHINRNRQDNRITNLRDVSVAENLSNRDNRRHSKISHALVLVGQPWLPPSRSTDLTADLVRQALTYEPETGAFIWRVRAGRYPAGRRAGYINFHGRRMIRLTVGGKRYNLLASRLAWLYVSGVMPEAEMDHINGDPADDRILNLRLADRSQQLANTRLNKRNTSGYRGVSQQRNGNWLMQVAWRGKHYRQFGFPTAEAASVAYAKVAAELHGEFVRS